MAQSPYVKSNFPRVPGDYYPTIDKRCVYALLQCAPILKQQIIVDVCAPNGSGIISTLKEVGYENSFCKPDAFEDMIFGNWIATNPPYTRPLVDQILERQIIRVCHNHFDGFASLHRANFDFAKSREYLFKDNPYYFGQIKMCFRPYWAVKTKESNGPIHNFVWHIWRSTKRESIFPATMYADGDLHE